MQMQMQMQMQRNVAQDATDTKVKKGNLSRHKGEKRKLWKFQAAPMERMWAAKWNEQQGQWGLGAVK
jgi:hypothetical protein